MYVKASDIKAHWEANKTRPLNFSGADEAELEKALKESMKTFQEEDRRNGYVTQGYGQDQYGQGQPDQDEGGMVGSVLNKGHGAAKEEEKKF